jgi:anti-sigma-K factor RskA
MNGSMNSERLQLLIAGYVLGNLDADEAAEFEQIVINDPAIAEEVSQMQSALEESFGVSDIPPPADLRSAILSADQPSERSAIPISSATSKNQSRRSLPWNRIIHVAAAVTIVALGISNYRLWRTLQASQSETQPAATFVYSLQATSENNTAAAATVAVAPDRLKAVLTVQNLPPLPPGKVYVLWTVVRKDAPVTRDAKSAILTEVFNVDAQGNISQVIGVPEVFRSANLVSNMAVTIEEAIAPEQHQGKPVLIAS